MPVKDPLGLMYFAIDSHGVRGVGFASFSDQRLGLSHSDEWVPILEEILEQRMHPLFVRECRHSEWLELAQEIVEKQ